MKKKKVERGFALFTVLIFIGILSEIIVSMMNSVLLTSKIMQNISVYYSYIYKTDRALEDATKCILSKDMDCLNTWLSVEGNFLQEGEKLKYKINLLQTTPCFQIKDAKTTGADFFKISIRLLNKSDSINIESTFASDTKNITYCSDKVKVIEPGIKSWRVVPSIFDLSPEQNLVV